MSNACTPILVDVPSPVSEILLPSKTLVDVNLVGVLLQLPPVNCRPVFQNVSSTIVKQR